LQYEKIHIDEERNNLLWYLITIVAIALAAFLLIDAYLAVVVGIVFYKLAITLLLIGVAAYSVTQINKPVYHFDLSIDDSMLIIDVYKGDYEPSDRQKLPLSEIGELRIAPHVPRKQNEALFDFTTNYYLLYRNNSARDYKRLIYPGRKFFTFKVEDIRKMIAFLSAHDETLLIPSDQELFMEQLTTDDT
jgi:hypothetical protein